MVYQVCFYGRPVGSDGVMRWISAWLNASPEAFVRGGGPEDDPFVKELYERYDHVQHLASASHVPYLHGILGLDSDGYNRRHMSSKFVKYRVDDSGDAGEAIGEDMLDGDRLVLWPAKVSRANWNPYIGVLARSYLPGSLLSRDEAVSLTADYLFELLGKGDDFLAKHYGCPNQNQPVIVY